MDLTDILKSVELRWIVHQDGLSYARIRGPARKQVHHTAIVDLLQRGNVGSFAAGDLIGVGVRPITAPEYALRVRFD